MEIVLTKMAHSRLEHSLYDICKDASLIDPKLLAKHNDPNFVRIAFIDKDIGPKLKAIAIAQFWKTNKE